MLLRISLSDYRLKTDFVVSTSKGTKNIPVEIVNPVFIDPENKRLVS